MISLNHKEQFVQQITRGIFIVGKIVFLIAVALLAWGILSPNTCFIPKEFAMRACGLSMIVLTLVHTVDGKFGYGPLDYRYVLFSKHPLVFSVIGGMLLSVSSLFLVFSLGLSFVYKYCSYGFQFLFAGFLSFTILTFLIGLISAHLKFTNDKKPLPGMGLEGTKPSPRFIVAIILAVITVIVTIFVVKSASGSTSEAYQKAIWYCLHNQYRESISQLDKVIKLEPNNSQAYHARGFDYYKLGQDQKAINDYTKAIGLDPMRALPYSNRSMAYAHLKQYQKAIDDCSKSIELAPRLTDAYCHRGIAYSMSGQYQKAIDDFSLALALHPTPNVYSNRANVYCKLEQYEKAIDDLSKAIGLEPQSAELYANLGDTYRMKGKYQQAINDCSKAVELDPKLAYAYHIRGQAHQKLSQYDAAKKDFAQAKKLGYKLGADDIDLSVR